MGGRSSSVCVRACVCVWRGWFIFFFAPNSSCYWIYLPVAFGIFRLRLRGRDILRGGRSVEREMKKTEILVEGTENAVLSEALPNSF